MIEPPAERAPRYCELDTFAMYAIWKKLLEIADPSKMSVLSLHLEAIA
jgi:hypothetical protein